MTDTSTNRPMYGKNKRSLLTDDDVRGGISMLNAGERRSYICVKHKCSFATVGRIARGDSYKHVSREVAQ